MRPNQDMGEAPQEMSEGTPRANELEGRLVSESTITADTRAAFAEIQLTCSDRIFALALSNYRAAWALVPAAAKTASASCSAIGMNVWTTSASNCVFELSTKRRMASAWGRPFR